MIGSTNYQEKMTIFWKFCTVLKNIDFNFHPLDMEWRCVCYFASMLFSSPQFVCFSATWNCMLFCNICYCMLLCNIFVIFVSFSFMDHWYSLFLLYKGDNSEKYYFKKMKSIWNIFCCMLLCNMSVVFFNFLKNYTC